ncbi:MAG: CGNR zinc finger domain-containing protein [Streptosporangiaceae bacterium]
MKACGNPDCRWAFYDRSHSRAGAWCDMATCGNRIKNRRLRQRQRRAAAPAARHPARMLGNGRPGWRPGGVR